MSKINKSIHYHRTKYNDGAELLEKALAEEWEKENKPVPGINYGHGTLQDLYLSPHSKSHKPKLLSDNERTAAATAIQWLGTNCGLSFLRTALKKAGYYLDNTENTKLREEKWAELTNRDKYNKIYAILE